jgi:hypothetical protein
VGGKDRKWPEKKGLELKRSIVERGRTTGIYRKGAEKGLRKKKDGQRVPGSKMKVLQKPWPSVSGGSTPPHLPTLNERRCPYRFLRRNARIPQDVLQETLYLRTGSD